MRRRVPILAVAIGAAALAAVALWYIMDVNTLTMFMPILPPEEAYPRAPAMPAPVAETCPELLTKYERMLGQAGSKVLSALQPGLADVEIDALEAKYQFKLPSDLRALYRWRNGTGRSAWVEAFPDHQFIPLDQALAEREALRQAIQGETAAFRKLHASLIGHRQSWLGLLTDGSGDGYFFDPARTEAEGSFFFNFAEDGQFVFFPAFRNYLAAVIEGKASGVFKFGERGAETVDFERAQALWSKYGAENVR
ncbi:MAG TPA: SMI1/KNR4 family protein [Gemmataceae bacterium]|nr:SMI1/KNR4 family protein [Gemmataceae bacterium]